MFKTRARRKLERRLSRQHSESLVDKLEARAVSASEAEPHVQTWEETPLVFVPGLFGSRLVHEETKEKLYPKVHHFLCK